MLYQKNVTLTGDWVWNFGAGMKTLLVVRTNKNKNVFIHDSLEMYRKKVIVQLRKYPPFFPWVFRFIKWLKDTVPQFLYPLVLIPDIEPQTGTSSCNYGTG